ncbi:hypothetical protein GCM10028787_10830 [Brachybacterium horti]
MASIQKRPDGRWRARYRDAQKKEHARHFTRKIDAQRWLDEVTTAVISGQYVDPNAGKITARQWYGQWADRQVWAEGTRVAAAQAIGGATFADLELRSVARSHVEQWVKTMTENGLAPSTIRTRFNYVSMGLRGAVRDRVIPVDPSAGVRLPRRRRADVAMSIPTVEQVGAALDAAPNEYRAAIAVCAFAGLRLGEMAGLRAEDLNLERGRLHVQRQVQGNNVATATVVPPKAGSEREIGIPDDLSAMLRTHLEHVGTIRDEAYLFGRGSDLLNRSSAGHIWRQIRTSIKLPAEYTLHTLRHFYASALISAGCDVVTVQRALGHSQPSITLNTYSHLWPSAEDRTRAAAADLMATVEKSRADSSRTIGPKLPAEQASQR